VVVEGRVVVDDVVVVVSASSGVESQAAEAELMMMALDAFKKLNVRVEIQFNNRKLLFGLLQQFQVPEDVMNRVILVLDKIEKISLRWDLFIYIYLLYYQLNLNSKNRFGTFAVSGLSHVIIEVFVFFSVGIGGMISK